MALRVRAISSTEIASSLSSYEIAGFPSAPPPTASQYGGLLRVANLLSVGGVLVVGAAWLGRRRWLPVTRSEVRRGRGVGLELVGDASGEVKRQAPADAAAPADAPVAAPTVAAPTVAAPAVAAAAAAAMAEAQLELASEPARARKHVEERKKTAPDGYARFDLD